MTDSPQIIFNCQFIEYHAPGKQSEEERFYRCRNGEESIIDYIDRDGASDKLSEEDAKRVQCFAEISPTEERSILGYAQNRQGSTGLFSKNPANDRAAIEKKLRKTKSNIWHAVLSFSSEIGKNYCKNKKDAQEILEKNLPFFFKKSHLNYDNIYWTGAFHNNTDNHHIHIVFWEEAPQYIDAKGNRKFTKKGVFDQSCFSDLKAHILQSFSGKKHEYFSMRDEIRSVAINSFRSNAALFSAFLTDGASIVAEGKYQYARLSTEQKKMVDGYVQAVIRNTPQLKLQYDTYLDHLEGTQAEIFRLYKANNTTPPPSAASFFATRRQECDTRLANAFLKQLKDVALEKKRLEQQFGFVNGTWEPSKMSPKSRKTAISRSIQKTASAAIKAFISSANEEISSAQKTDEQYRHELKEKGYEVIYE